MTVHAAPPTLYGLMAEFERPEGLVRAARAAHEQGFRRLDAYSPYPIEELFEALHIHKTGMPVIMLIGGIVGCIAGFALQYYCNVYDYPINVGGRPLNSWPSWIPIMFELTVLTSALSGIFGLLGLCGLPMPYHPVFNVPAFVRASRDRFFLCIEARDPKFELAATKQFLAGLGPREVTEVAP